MYPEKVKGKCSTMVALQLEKQIAVLILDYLGAAKYPEEVSFQFIKFSCDSYATASQRKKKVQR